MIISNTTVARPATLVNVAKGETGGLSGRPLFAPSTQLLAQAFLRVEGKIPLVGVGGIESAETAWTKISAGASLIQFYTAMVYKGPGLVREITQGLAARLKAEGMVSISQVVGQSAEGMARGEGL